MSSPSSRARVTTVSEIVPTEPGGRYSASRASVAGWATANPTRRPARAYAFEAVRTTTRFANRDRSGIMDSPVNSA